MNTVGQIAALQSGHSFFTRTELALWVGGSRDRQYAMLKRALASGEVVRIRRGLYTAAAPYRKQLPHPFAVAQHVYGPSYISFESALSYHGWIPEAVYTVSCASLSRSRVFDTPLGRFEYMRVPQRSFYAGVARIEHRENGEAFFMASPLKALADLVYMRRFEGELKDLLGGLRIDAERVMDVQESDVVELKGNSRSRHVMHYLEQVEGEVE